MFYDNFGVIPHEKYFYIPTNEYSAFPKPVDSHVASILSGVNDVIIVMRFGGGKKFILRQEKALRYKNFLTAIMILLHYEEDRRRSAAMYAKKRN